VAYLNSNDRHHDWAVSCWSALHDPIWTCEAVLTEAIFLMQSDGGSAEPILRLVERGIVKIEFSCGAQWPDLSRLIRKYRDRPMSLADACLVRMAELADESQVFTTDRDFLVYRRRGRHVIPLLAPFSA
jgi:predicted nucleic acid-binding protein